MQDELEALNTMSYPVLAAKYFSISKINNALITLYICMYVYVCMYT